MAIGQSRSARCGGRSRAGSRPSATSISASAAARCSASSAPTAPARRPPCGCSARCCRRPAGAPASPASTSSPTAPTVRRRIGVALQEIGARPRADRAASCSSSSAACTGITAARTPSARRGAARARRAHRRRRPAHQDLLGRHEAAARPRERARPLARGAVPRRADHRPRPASRLTVWDEVRRINSTRARPSSSPPSTSRRPTSSATGSRSSTPAGSSPRARPRA